MKKPSFAFIFTDHHRNFYLNSRRQYYFRNVTKKKSAKQHYLPIGRCTIMLLLKSKDLSRARSPMRGGRFVISLHPASSSANADILPNSSGRDANLL